MVLENLSLGKVQVRNAKIVMKPRLESANPTYERPGGVNFVFAVFDFSSKRKTSHEQWWNPLNSLICSRILQDRQYEFVDRMSIGTQLACVWDSLVVAAFSQIEQWSTEDTTLSWMIHDCEILTKTRMPQPFGFEGWGDLGVWAVAQV